MTTWGADPSPRGTCLTSPLLGSSRPSAPWPCAVYQTVPSGAGATSCGPAPSGTGKYCTVSAWADEAAKQPSMANAAIILMRASSDVGRDNTDMCCPCPVRNGITAGLQHLTGAAVDSRQVASGAGGFVM